ncbi:hypothetical protein BEP19_06005 [Ammoniphilus oxalaticus]|uniref:DUF2533 domain-containing protein n=1 Tax=Ammoniphilus oxalaticus TaxID=66863 RepID=A0A419SIX8_9BACL|nr:DUF2533 family protein [Ammoniphilus oxalaticus]RKD23971.1 hypothetical protein BEP19_06005 [Ammoniphilus oxalaticus]
MGVHLEISKNVKSIRQIIGEYKRLDGLREREIEEAIQRAKQKETFSVESINRVTEALNQYAATHHLPLRKQVTVDMINEICHQA